MELKNTLFKLLLSILGFVIFLIWSIKYIRFDAELFIFLSVILVLFTVWNSLTVMLSKYLFVKSTVYYYYFLRYYQARLWLIYSIYTFVKFYLFTKRLPYFNKWYNFYLNNTSVIILKELPHLVERWDIFLNYFLYALISNLMIILWTGFYKYSFNLFLISTNGVNYRQNWRKLTEYVLLNKTNFN
jgi:hypothetical protein